MDALEELRRNREARVNNIQKGFASDEMDIQKAQVGEHRNFQGKDYVWTEFAPGKFGWRRPKDGQAAAQQNTSQQKQSAQSSDKTVEDDYDKDEYKRQQGMVAKIDDEYLHSGFELVKTNLSNKEKELSKVLSERPGAKATIAKLEKEVKYFKGQKKAFEEEVKKRDKKPAMKENSKNK